MKQIKPLLLIIFLCRLTTNLRSQQFPKAVGYVNDFGNVITASVEQEINNISQEVEQKTGAQIVNVTIYTIGDEDYRDYECATSIWADGLCLLSELQDRSHIPMRRSSLIAKVEKRYYNTHVGLPGLSSG